MGMKVHGYGWVRIQFSYPCRSLVCIFVDVGRVVVGPVYCSGYVLCLGVQQQNSSVGVSK